MKNLGKVALSLLLTTTLFAQVSADVDQSVVSPGNVVNFSLHVSDESFDEPQIQKLCGVNVLGRSSQTSIQDVNGKFKKTQTLTYSFSPEQSCTIEPLEINTASGIEKTEPITIEVRALSADAKAQYSLVYITDAKDVYVGEPFEITLVSKVRRDMKVADSKFEPSDMQGVWIKKQFQDQTQEEGDYIVTRVHYIIAAQRAGDLTIAPAKMSLGKRGNAQSIWGDMIPNISWSRYISNSLHVNIKSLPKGVDLVGDMHLNVEVDKTKVNQNEPVNATINIQGDGNFEDIGSLKPFIPKVSVFEDEAKIDQDKNIPDQETKYSKKMAFVADANFTIPSIEIKYFNIKTKSVETLRSKPIAIEVVGGAAMSSTPLTIEKASPIEALSAPSLMPAKLSWIPMLLSGVVGFILGVLLMLLKPSFKREKKSSVVSGDLKAVLAKLMDFREDPEVKEMIDILEMKLYSDSTLEIDKAKLKELRKRYKF